MKESIIVKAKTMEELNVLVREKEKEGFKENHPRGHGWDNNYYDEAHRWICAEMEKVT